MLHGDFRMRGTLTLELSKFDKSTTDVLPFSFRCKNKRK